MNTIVVVLHILSFSAWLGVILFLRGVLVPASRPLPSETRLAVLDRARRRLDLMVAFVVPLVFASGLTALVLHWEGGRIEEASRYLTVAGLKLLLASVMVVIHYVQRFSCGPELAAIEADATETSPDRLRRLESVWTRWLLLLEANAGVGLVVLGLGLLL